MRRALLSGSQSAKHTVNHPAMMLAAARCKYVADGSWGQRRYLDMGRLDGWDEREVLAEQEGGAGTRRD